MEIVDQKQTKTGYELITKEGYAVDAKLSFGELSTNWILTAEWGETHESQPLKVGTLGNIDPIESMLQLVKTMERFDIQFDPTLLIG